LFFIYEKINFNTIKGVFPYSSNKINNGKIIYYGKISLIIFEAYTIIKIYNKDLININPIGIIGQELNSTKDILLFGLISRNKIPKDDVLYLLDKIYIKEDDNFRIRFSYEIYDVIKEYLSKRKK